MLLRKTELNPVFKNAQPLPTLSREPVAVRGCAAPCVMPNNSLSARELRRRGSSLPHFARRANKRLLAAFALLW